MVYDGDTMKEKQYAIVFVSKPIWNKNGWQVWTSPNPIEGGFIARIPLPKEFVPDVLEDAEIIKK